MNRSNASCRPAPPTGGVRQQGLTLVELMVSMTVGLLVLAAVLSVFAGSRRSYDVSESEARMLDNARFALHMLEQDISAAGSYGQTNWPAGIERRAGTGNQLGAMTAATDCGDRWYIDVDDKIFVSNDANPYNGTCIPASAAYKTDTDVLVLRYASATPVADDNTVASTVYVQSVPGHGRLFTTSDGVPTIAADSNYVLQSSAYYVSSNTENADGIPSLHRISLTAGPGLTDTLIAPGVEFFHVQLGLQECNPDCTGSVAYYVDADHPDVNWAEPEFQDQVIAARVWLLMRADQADNDGFTDSNTYVMGRFSYTPNDSFRRTLVTSVFRIRNGTAL